MAKKGLKNKYKDIVGQPIRKDQLSKWDSKRFMEWFALVYYFCPKGEWDFPDIAFKNFCFQAEERPIWEEWMWRYGLNKDEVNVQSARGSITGVTRHIGEYLQSSPHVITKEMKEIMKGHPVLEKYTEPFTVKETVMGEIVEAAPNLKLPEVQYNEALLKLAAIMNDLMKGITFEDIKKMSAPDRIELALKIVKTMNTIQGGQKANLNIFKQIIINEAGRDDLERLMIEAVKE